MPARRGRSCASIPDLTIWVSEVGAPHLVDPSRLERSARRLYGDAFDPLWGELAPVPEHNVRVAAGDVLGWEAFPAPGHASHHVLYFREGTILAGDACGIRIQPSRRILPVAPPPDIDLEAWHATIAEIERRSPDRLALIHFGVETGVADHLERLGEELDRWASPRPGRDDARGIRRRGPGGRGRGGRSVRPRSRPTGSPGTAYAATGTSATNKRDESEAQ